MRQLLGISLAMALLTVPAVAPLAAADHAYLHSLEGWAGRRDGWILGCYEDQTDDDDETFCFADCDDTTIGEIVGGRVPCETGDLGH